MLGAAQTVGSMGLTIGIAALPLEAAAQAPYKSKRQQAAKTQLHKAARPSVVRVPARPSLGQIQGLHAVEDPLELGQVVGGLVHWLSRSQGR